MTRQAFFELALSFPGAETRPHFERMGFKVHSKRMFATYLEKDNSANIFLSPAEQRLFCEMSGGIYLVPNQWGEKGTTTLLLNQVPAEIVREALLAAYQAVLGSGKSQ